LFEIRELNPFDLIEPFFCFVVEKKKKLNFSLGIVEMIGTC